MTMVSRAYSLLDVKAFDDEKRTFSGIASTPSIDRMGDIVDPLGAIFALPMALLLDHDIKKQVGHVEFAKPNKNGIPFKASIPIVTEPGQLKDLVDYAWDLVKYRLRSFVSIGFSALKYEIMKDGGYNFTSWEWLELSLVSIPAQSEAVIHEGKSLEAAFLAFKSIDAPLLAATGKEPKDSDRPTPPAPGKQINPVVKAMEAKTMTKKTIAEQKSAFQATRDTKSARMTEIMDTANEKGETLDAAAKEEYDGLKADLKEIDEHLVRLTDMEAINIRAATVVNGSTQDDAAASRIPGALKVPATVAAAKKLPPGIGFTRFVMATAMAKGNPMHAVEIFKSREQWMQESPGVLDVLKTVVAPGSTTDSTWGGALVNYQILTDEFIEYLRPLTIIGRLTGLTRVPFKVKIPRQTGGATVNWVGEGAPKPLTSMAFDTVTLEFAKIAGIIVLNEELLRLGTPSAELLVRNDLAKSIVQFMDAQFVDPTKAAVTNVSPASITNGVTPTIATGTTGAALRADMKTVLGGFLTANMQVSNVGVLMSQRLALGISLMTNSLGQKEFPGLTMNGGDLLGLPVITSENIPSTGGSPTDGDPIIIVSQPDILLADDGQVTIDASREASLQMDTAPDSPATASTVMISLWQQNQIGLRAERWVNWAKRRSTAVAYISNAKYFE